MESLHGRLEGTGSDRAMLLTREVGIGIDELWRWITDSDRTAQWYGPWRTADGSTPSVGDEVLVTMSEEEPGEDGAMESGMRIDACERPSRLVLISTATAPHDWPITLLCEESGLDGESGPGGEGSAITLRHDRIPADVPLADLGAGWEFCLGRLVAAIKGGAALTFEQCQAVYGPQYAELG